MQAAAPTSAPPASVAQVAPAAVGPSVPLVVPQEFVDRLEHAAAEGRTLIRQFAREHSPAERWMIPKWALLKMGWPPKTDDVDLAYLRQVAATRTPEGVERARFWGAHGLDAEWEKLLQQYTSKVGPAQARAAQKLLNDALMLTNEATQAGKAAANRQRPFVVDPSFPLALDRPGNNPSYPSGHTTAAYAAALVLAHLMPDRKAEFLGMAREASWARVYGGVHFPSDVVAGVKMATVVTGYLTSVTPVKPRRGTRPAGGNTGVTGTLGRRPRVAAAELAGPALLNAGRLV